MRKSIYICLGIILSLGSELIGQDQTRRLRFQHLTTQDGLSQNMIDCIIQDQNGFLWFGTWNGLCKYDGYEFEVFNDQNTGGQYLGNNFIYTLYQDQFSNLWVGTKQGLFLYLIEKKRFVQIVDESNGLLKFGTYRDIIGNGPNSILIGSTYGLVEVNIKNEMGEYEVKRSLPLNNSSLSKLVGTTVQTMCKTNNDTVWVGTDQRLYKLDEDLNVQQQYTFKPSDVNSLTSNVILKIRELSNGEIWIGTEVGLNKYPASTDNFTRYYNDPANTRSLIHNTVMDMTEDHEANLIIATLGGISIKKPGEEVFSNYFREPENPYGLNNDFLNCLLIDNDQNLWVGSERGGLNIAKSNSSYFEGVAHEFGNPNSLSSNTINSIYEDNKYLWVGTAGGGLNRINKSSNKVTIFKNEGGQPQSISGDFVTSILKDSRGKLWVGTWGLGLNRLNNLDTNSKYGFDRFSAENSGLTSNFISSILEDHKGRIWIGTLHGLVVYDPKNESFVDYFSDQGYEINKGVGCLVQDAHDKLWVGTRDGLFRIDLEDPKKDVLSFYHDPNRPNTISNNYIISLIEDRQGNIWCGTYGQGLNKISNEGEEFTIKSFNSTNNGLSNNIVYGIVEDDDGKLWLSTDYGLTRFDPDTELSRNFFISEGLRNNQYYWGAYFKNNKGKLYFGGMNGIDTFYPSWISEDINDPSVRITDVKLLNESVIPNMEYNGIIVANDAITSTDEIQLSYKEKIITFEFSSFHFLDADLISYAYKLEGFDKQWNQAAPGRRSTSYTNLKPGKYKFLVRASGHDGRFSGDPAAITINVLPPFWETLWFRVLSILGSISLVVGYLRYRLYVLKKQKADLEKQVELRTQEINRQKEAISRQAEQLKHSNEDLAAKQELIEGQNRQLEKNNTEISSKRDELMQLNEKLNLVSQLRLSFFTNISHEFRTPLTLIIGPMERLLSQFSLQKEVRDNLDMVNRNAKQLLHQINEIMDFRKIEKGEVGLTITKIKADDLSRSTFEVFKPLAEIKNIALEYEIYKGGDYELCLDEKKVENILYNLLSNAVKYTPDGGKVKLEVRTFSLADSLMNGNDNLDRNTPVISFKIIDSGKGISEENLPLIFKRFFRIESENAFNIEGSGIGLAITEELIRVHEGQIQVSSEVGHGSVFEVQLPDLSQLATARSNHKEPSVSINIQDQIDVLKNELLVKGIEKEQEVQDALDQSRDTILIVEDNLDLRRFVAERLGEKYNVLLAQDGEFGESLAIEYNPDLIVSDVMMPRKNGLELCQAIKSNFSTSHIPVILLTAKSSVENQITGLETGADDYLAKPFNFELLEARIFNLLESRRQLKKRFSQQDLPPGDLATNKKDEEFLSLAMSTVSENMSNSEFGIQNLTRALGVSRSLLHTKLTSLTGQSTTEFVNNLKIKEAKQMLRKGELTISEVAYATGYNDPKYFSRLFSKQTGQSPKQYQEEQNSSTF